MCNWGLFGESQKKQLVFEGETRVVGVLVLQIGSRSKVAILTLVRTFVGFIFKISYDCKCPPLSMGLASNSLFAMVSAGSFFRAPFRVGVLVGTLATGTVWKVRACGKGVVDTYDHRHASTVLRTLNKLIAATNEEPCPV